MTFAAKYEILEAVTRGAVETFVARRIATDERVIVHIFECREQQPNQPTVQWVLESFRAVAPDPPELVVEAGRYEGTSYGYLVTKLPRESELHAWARSYEAKQTAAVAVAPVPIIPPDSHETTKQVVDTSPAGEQPTRFLGVVEKPEEITKAFEALRSELKSSSATGQAPSSASTDQEIPGTISAQLRAIGLEGTAPEAPKTPGDFTRQFFPAIGQYENVPASAGRPSTPGKEDGKGSGVGSGVETPSAILRKIVLPSSDEAPSLGTDSSPRPRVPEPTPGPVSSTDKTGTISTGEFTNFFRGPFDGKRHAEVPDLSAPVARPENETGEFTKMFGPSKEGSSARFPAPQEVKSSDSSESESGSFTKLFESTDADKKTPDVPEPDLRPRDQADTGSGAFSAKARSWQAPVPGPPKAPAESVSSPFRDKAASSGDDVPFASRAGSEGATRAFSPSTREPAPDFSSLPAGPSEYTRVISGGNRSPAPPQPTIASERGPSPEPPAISLPQQAAPQPPKLAPLPTAAPRVPAIPWPMILTLSGLFLLAILLVLYFLFKR